MTDLSLPVAEVFDLHAETYHQTVDTSVSFSGKDLAFFTAAKAYHLRKIGSRLRRPFAQASVLDVGCGAGGLDRLLVPHVGELVGVDVSEGMLNQARGTNPEASYHLYAGDLLPFDDKSFDLVFAVCVVHHVDPAGWDDFVNEMWRVTQPGGAAVIIEHNPLNPLTRRSVAGCEFDADAVLTRPGPLVKAFRRLGASRVRTRYILFTPAGGDRIQSAERRLVGHCPLGAQYIVEAARA